MNLLLCEYLVETVEGGEVRVHHTREAQEHGRVLAVFHSVVSVWNRRRTSSKSRKTNMASVLMTELVAGKESG